MSGETDTLPQRCLQYNQSSLWLLLRAFNLLQCIFISRRGSARPPPRSQQHPAELENSEMSWNITLYCYFCLSSIRRKQGGSRSHNNRLSIRCRTLGECFTMIFFNKWDQTQAGKLVKWETIMTYSGFFPAGIVLFYKVICENPAWGKWAWAVRFISPKMTRLQIECLLIGWTRKKRSNQY